MYYSEGFNFCLTVSHGYPLGPKNKPNLFFFNSCGNFHKISI